MNTSQCHAIHNFDHDLPISQRTHPDLLGDACQAPGNHTQNGTMKIYNVIFGQEKLHFDYPDL
jgi:hypothetical protein